jgi:hypothetical protein
MGISVNRDELFDALASGLVELGNTPERSAEIVDAVFDAANAAGIAAMLTIEATLPDFGVNGPSAQHLTVQVLIARLQSVLNGVEDDLVAAGAVRRDVPIGVGDHG